MRTKLDDSDQSMGWKCAQYAMRGVPLRIEIGPRDLENGQCCIVRRDNGEKTFVALDTLESAVKELLDRIHDNMLERARANLEENTFDLSTWEEVKEMASGRGGCAREVVRQPRVRAGHEGKGGRFLPLYAAAPVRHKGQVRVLRQGSHDGHLLGSSVLKNKGVQSAPLFFIPFGAALRSAPRRREAPAATLAP